MPRERGHFQGPGRSPRLALGLALVLALTACGDAAPESPDALPVWRLSPEPTAVIGAVDGDEGQLFTQLWGVHLTSEGRLFVADQGARIFAYEPDGSLRDQVGRPGEGPGEFGMIAVPFGYRGDSVAVWDLFQSRIAIFDGEGELGRTVRVPIQWRPTPGTTPAQSCCWIRSAFADGSFALEYPALTSTESGPPRHAQLTIARVSPEGTVIDTVGTFPDRHSRMDASAPSGVRSDQMSTPFSYAVLGDTLFGGNGEGGIVHRVTLGGARDTLRLPVESRPVTADVRAAFEQAWRDEYERNSDRFHPGSLETILEGTFVSHVPDYIELLTGPRGELWLRQWQLPFTRDAVHYHVHSTEGEPLGRVELPARARLMAVGMDRVAFLLPDELDVPIIHIHTIER